MKLCKDCKWFTGDTTEPKELCSNPKTMLPDPVRGQHVRQLAKECRHYELGVCGSRANFWEPGAMAMVKEIPPLSALTADPDAYAIRDSNWWRYGPVAELDGRFSPEDLRALADWLEGKE